MCGENKVSAVLDALGVQWIIRICLEPRFTGTINKVILDVTPSK